MRTMGIFYVVIKMRKKSKQNNEDDLRDRKSNTYVQYVILLSLLNDMVLSAIY